MRKSRITARQFQFRSTNFFCGDDSGIHFSLPENSSGSLTAACYRAVQGISALIRIPLIAFLAAGKKLLGRPVKKGSIRKWFAIFKWSIGLESWAAKKSNGTERTHNQPNLPKHQSNRNQKDHVRYSGKVLFDSAPKVSGRNSGHAHAHEPSRAGWQRNSSRPKCGLGHLRLSIIDLSTARSRWRTRTTRCGLFST